MKKKLSEEERKERAEKLGDFLMNNCQPVDDEYSHTCEYPDELYLENKTNKESKEFEKNIDKEKFRTLNKKYTGSEKSIILDILRAVKNIQDSDINYPGKTKLIKDVLWTKRNSKGKLLIGGLFGTLFGLAIFGTGGMGIVALGGATGLWGFLAGTTGGILVSSLIQNFENKK